jgi:hypothetical protein
MHQKSEITCHYRRFPRWSSPTLNTRAFVVFVVLKHDLGLGLETDPPPLSGSTASASQFAYIASHKPPNRELHQPSPPYKKYFPSFHLHFLHIIHIYNYAFYLSLTRVLYFTGRLPFHREAKFNWHEQKARSWSSVLGLQP